MNYIKKTNYKNKTDWKCKIPHQQISICKNKRKNKNKKNKKNETNKEGLSENNYLSGWWVRRIHLHCCNFLRWLDIQIVGIRINIHFQNPRFSTYSSSAMSNKFNAIIKWDRNRCFEKKQTNKQNLETYIATLLA